jgi:hypothetical protein
VSERWTGLAHPAESPEVQNQPDAAQDYEARRLIRSRVLAGVINEYRYAS